MEPKFRKEVLPDGTERVTLVKEAPAGKESAAPKAADKKEKL